jgi:hypothetical protein
MIRAGLAVILVTVLALPGHAADSDFQRESLAGLRTVGVMIEELAPEAEQGGLTSNLLQTDVEVRLRKAGLRVAEGPERLQAPAFVYVNVNTAKWPRPKVYAVSVSVQLMEPVSLVRNPARRRLAATWDNGAVGLAHASDFAATVRAKVGDLVDRFLNDYLAANPKP